MKYKVCYSGFYYVVADSPEEAQEKALDDQSCYEELSIDSVCEVSEFYVGGV